MVSAKTAALVALAAVLLVASGELSPRSTPGAARLPACAASAQGGRAGMGRARAPPIGHTCPPPTPQGLTPPLARPMRAPPAPLPALVPLPALLLVLALALVPWLARRAGATCGWPGTLAGPTSWARSLPVSLPAPAQSPAKVGGKWFPCLFSALLGPCLMHSTPASPPHPTLAEQPCLLLPLALLQSPPPPPCPQPPLPAPCPPLP